MGEIVAPKRYAYILIPQNCEWNFIWKEELQM